MGFYVDIYVLNSNIVEELIKLIKYVLIKKILSVVTDSQEKLKLVHKVHLAFDT